TRVANNTVSECGGYGLYVFRPVKDLTVVGNSFVFNGQTSGFDAGIRVHSTTTRTDGSIQGNAFADYQAAPTQTVTIRVLGSAVLTNVNISGNTDTPVALRSDTRLKRKASTTTINASTTLAVMAGYTLPLKAGEYY